MIKTNTPVATVLKNSNSRLVMIPLLDQSLNEQKIKTQLIWITPDRVNLLIKEIGLPILWRLLLEVQENIVRLKLLLQYVQPINELINVLKSDKIITLIRDINEERYIITAQYIYFFPKYLWKV